VTETASPISTVIPGPNARNSDDSATSSPVTPAATVIPATTTIGR